jgi:hypothetical protein
VNVTVNFDFEYEGETEEREEIYEWVKTLLESGAESCSCYIRNIDLETWDGGK